MIKSAVWGRLPYTDATDEETKLTAREAKEKYNAWMRQVVLPLYEKLTQDLSGAR